MEQSGGTHRRTMHSGSSGSSKYRSSYSGAGNMNSASGLGAGAGAGGQLTKFFSHKGRASSANATSRRNSTRYNDFINNNTANLSSYTSIGRPSSASNGAVLSDNDASLPRVGSNKSGNNTTGYGGTGTLLTQTPVDSGMTGGGGGGGGSSGGSGRLITGISYDSLRKNIASNRAQSRYAYDSASNSFVNTNTTTGSGTTSQPQQASTMNNNNNINNYNNNNNSESQVFQRSTSDYANLSGIPNNNNNNNNNTGSIIPGRYDSTGFRTGSSTTRPSSSNAYYQSKQADKNNANSSNTLLLRPSNVIGSQRAGSGINTNNNGINTGNGRPGSSSGLYSHHYGPVNSSKQQQQQQQQAILGEVQQVLGILTVKRPAPDIPKGSVSVSMNTNNNVNIGHLRPTTSGGGGGGSSTNSNSNTSENTRTESRCKRRVTFSTPLTTSQPLQNPFKFQGCAKLANKNNANTTKGSSSSGSGGQPTVTASMLAARSYPTTTAATPAAATTTSTSTSTPAAVSTSTSTSTSTTNRSGRAPPTQLLHPHPPSSSSSPPSASASSALETPSSTHPARTLSPTAPNTLEATSTGSSMNNNNINVLQASGNSGQTSPSSGATGPGGNRSFFAPSNRGVVTGSSVTAGHNSHTTSNRGSSSTSPITGAVNAPSSNSNSTSTSPTLGMGGNVTNGFYPSNRPPLFVSSRGDEELIKPTAVNATKTGINSLSYGLNSHMYGSGGARTGGVGSDNSENDKFPKLNGNNSQNSSSQNSMNNSPQPSPNSSATNAFNGNNNSTELFVNPSSVSRPAGAKGMVLSSSLDNITAAEAHHSHSNHHHHHHSHSSNSSSGSNNNNSTVMVDNNAEKAHTVGRSVLRKDTFGDLGEVSGLNDGATSDAKPHQSVPVTQPQPQQQKKSFRPSLSEQLSSHLTIGHPKAVSKSGSGSGSGSSHSASTATEARLRASTGSSADSLLKLKFATGADPDTGGPRNGAGDGAKDPTSVRSNSYFSQSLNGAISASRQQSSNDPDYVLGLYDDDDINDVVEEESFTTTTVTNSSTSAAYAATTSTGNSSGSRATGGKHTGSTTTHSHSVTSSVNEGESGGGIEASLSDTNMLLMRNNHIICALPAKCFSIGSLACKFPAKVMFYQEHCEYPFNHPIKATVVNMCIYYRDMMGVSTIGTKFRFKLARKFTQILGDFDSMNANHLVTLELTSTSCIAAVREKILPLIQQLAK